MENYKSAEDSTGLKTNAIGWLSVFFMVITTNGPLTAMAGGVPVSIALGNGFGLPGSYVIASVVYLVFAVGFCAMSPYMKGSGAFYAYISRGLTPVAGIAAAAMAIFAYYGVLLAIYGMFGFFLHEALLAAVGIDVHWAILCMVGASLTYLFSVLGIDFSGRVLIVLMLLEVGIILLCDLLGLLQVDLRQNISLAVFEPSTVFSSGFGPSLIFVVASFMGFETAAIYSQEVRDAKRAIPLAMYSSIAFIGLLYTGSVWLMLTWYGPEQAMALSSSDPGSMWFGMLGALTSPAAVHVAMMLVITSLFAAMLSFTNVIARYWYALGKTHIVSPRLARTCIRSGAPVAAARMHLLITLILLVACVALKADPMMEVLPLASTPAAIGVVIVQCMAAIAVIGFFRQNRRGVSVWRAVIAPLISATAMAYFVYQMIINVDLLSGRADLFAYGLALITPVVGGLGVIYAGYLRRCQSQKYRALSDFVSAG